MTTLIFTPKTPDCFRDGILFRLNSLLVNFRESFTETWMGRPDQGRVSEEPQENITSPQWFSSTLGCGLTLLTLITVLCHSLFCSVTWSS